jgi:PAS domain-containing protein
VSETSCLTEVVRPTETDPACRDPDAGGTLVACRWPSRKIDLRLGGTIRYVHCISRPAIDSAGEVEKLVGTNVDVTEQHNARAALEKPLRNQEIKR